MAKISSYSNNDPVSVNDRLIGTSSTGSPADSTKNFLISDVLALADASALTYPEGVLNDGSGNVLLGSATSGTGAIDFSGSRFQYLGVFKYVFGGNAGDEFFQIDGNLGALGVGIAPDATSVLRTQRGTDTGKVIEIIGFTSGFTSVSLGTGVGGLGTATLYDAAGSVGVNIVGDGDSYLAQGNRLGVGATPQAMLYVWDNAADVEIKIDNDTNDWDIKMPTGGTGVQVKPDTSEGVFGIANLAGTNQFSVDTSDGSASLSTYGSNAHGGSTGYLLGVSTSGDIIEVGGVAAPKSVFVADKDDYSPNDLLTKDIVELDFGAAVSLTGINATGIAIGVRKTLINVGAFTGTLEHQDVGSAAANRFNIGGSGPYTLPVNGAVDVRYTSSGWQVIG